MFLDKCLELVAVSAIGKTLVPAKDLRTRVIAGDNEITSRRNAGGIGDQENISLDTFCRRDRRSGERSLRPFCRRDRRPGEHSLRYFSQERTGDPENNRLDTLAGENRRSREQSLGHFLQQRQGSGDVTVNGVSPKTEYPWYLLASETLDLDGSSPGSRQAYQRLAPGSPS